MELLFLGTSSGVPTKTRNVSALAVQRTDGSGWCLVDCGEGTQHQLLHTRLTLSTLQAVFITHVHGDHCYGLPGLLASATLQGRKAPLPIYAPAALQGFIAAVCEHTQLRLGYGLEWQAVDACADTWQVDGLTIQATELSHRVPSYAYSFSEALVPRKLAAQRLLAAGIPSGPIWGALQRGGNVTLDDGKVLLAEDFLLPPRKAKKIIVAGDNDSPELLQQASDGADVLVHEATYNEAQATKTRDTHRHCSAAKAAQFAASAGIGNLVLTHFSPRYQEGTGASPSLAELADEARRHYSGNLFLARDFDRYVLGADYQLRRVDAAIQRPD